MKKIKKKKSSTHALPAFLVGWTHGEAPPPGYLSAWFDQQYGGPLQIRFLSKNGHQHFEAMHTNWRAHVQLAPSVESSAQWHDRLQWDHRNLALLVAPSQSHADRRDDVLHMARIAKGLTLLLEGTTYDAITGSYRNPSDWQDLELSVFRIQDHVQVEQYEQLQHVRTWYHTRGLSKFGLDEIETFRSLGLSGQGIEAMLYDIAGQLLAEGKNPKIGQQVTFGSEERQVKVVRHRTDPLYGMPRAFREIQFT